MCLFLGFHVYNSYMIIHASLTLISDGDFIHLFFKCEVYVTKPISDLDASIEEAIAYFTLLRDCQLSVNPRCIFVTECIGVCRSQRSQRWRWWKAGWKLAFDVALSTSLSSTFTTILQPSDRQRGPTTPHRIVAKKICLGRLRSSSSDYQTSVIFPDWLIAVLLFSRWVYTV